ncbi:FAD-dependent 2-octaprenylphenol hydroxylase [Glaesserella parasuis]|uniref:FAD-dependent monooxygenase n=1 Tax=Glaesserella parasuis serovar 5 (strain SH0165) TaxID=557723 RepID=B8F390_GLAP5|nr:FAD-dependent 2-octaprenylphenol hydroxylase [Glaesserella parasuis]ACL31792.1 FAD-dependent monooxygenase [Glaesserella parasuis SH0165]MDG6262547.1 FAD-dependent 2-octaprenylphenol hydroxylase [Glaesserella parasuis]MDG6304880.1 FAD-dependent 2-octaprenylphenol hydroxylase [Glaesserella parasuis]MDG6313591.1 FAD-dependent 2-octaprenylphenol hydroxylase [Glaesserella parasuis]MDG6315310.1 FAD-dependent 2-octaprenylphenol hydroxylase [Glaesserella parasuis]
MKTADITIIGGGMVGLALAGLLANSNCQIKIIDKTVPYLSKSISNRVSAINFTSQRMLEEIGAWYHISEGDLSPYDQMYVWEKDSFSSLCFDNKDPVIKELGLEQLGFIIDNQQIRYALWKQVIHQHNVEVILDAPKFLGINDNCAFLTLENGEMITSKLVIGADGAHSWVRQQAKIPLISRDYQHTALVCNVRTTEMHQQVARQVFSPDSILAFLPLKDEHLCSIVWSLPTLEASRLVNSDEKSFLKQLNIAFDNQLGICELQSERDVYPLTARYARDFAQQRIALIGDAAHTIHPLAGLGVNLGFADAILLAKELQKLLSFGKDIGEYRNLRQFERVRKLEAIKVLVAMEGLKHLFSGNNPFKKLVRGVGLSATNQNSFVKKLLIQQAISV